MRRLKARFGLLAAMALVVAGCSQGGSGSDEGPAEPSTTTDGGEQAALPAVGELGDVTLEMWQHTYPPLNDWTQARIDDFTSEHPNITVNLQAVPFQQYQDKLFTALASGDQPSFYEVNDWTMTQFVEAGVLAPLDVEALGFTSLDDMRSAYEGSSLDGAMFDGQLYGSPYDWSAPVLGVSNPMLEDAGIDKGSLTTWKTTLEAAAAMSESDDAGNLVTSGLSFVHGNDNYYKHQGNSLFIQAGASLLNDEGTASAINSPEATEVFEFWREAVHGQRVTQPGFTSTFYTNEFGEGRVGMGFMLTWANSILEPFDFEFGREYDLLPLPTFEGGQDALASYSWYWTVDSQASPEESAATHALIAHLADNSASMLTDAGLVLPRTEWFESQAAEVQTAYAPIRDALLKSQPVPGHPRYNELWEPVITVFESIEANPEADIAALLETAELEMNGILNRP